MSKPERQISRIDEELRALVERRKRLIDPVEVLEASQDIDVQLDQRLALMHAALSEERARV